MGRRTAELLLLMIVGILALGTGAFVSFWFATDVDIDGNEGSAVASLRQIVSVQASALDSWFGASQPGFWTLNVAGFYAVTNESGQPVRYIPLDLAAADTAIDEPAMQALLRRDGSSPPVPKDDYYFRAMDGEDNDRDGTMTVYRANTGWKGSPTTKVMHRYLFGFCAYPARYGQSGVRTFIVNEEGVVYGVDRGMGTPVLTWPGTDPTQYRATASSTGPRWRVVDE